MNKTINNIAKKFLSLDTLETRKNDSLDFSDQNVSQLKKALEAAYEAGKNDARAPGR